MKKLFICFFILLFVLPALAADENFCVSDGDEWNDAACVSDCATEVAAGTCMDGSDFDTADNWAASDTANKIDAGDTVYVADDGGDFRLADRIDIHQNGESGNVILITKYPGDTPVFSGFALDDTGTGWTGPDGNGEYYKTYATEPNVVVADGVKLYTGTVGSLESDEWGYSGTELYLGANPTGHSILEVAQSDRVININAKDYITFDGITAEGANADGEGAGFNIRDTSHHVIVQNCISRWNMDDGFKIDSSAGENNIIQDSTAYGNKIGVIAYDNDASLGNENIIRRNTLYNNWHSGVWSSSSYVIIEKNKIYDNGVDDSDCSKYNGGSGACDGSGISTFSSEGSDTIEGNFHIIRFNLIYNQKGDLSDGAAILTDIWSDHNEIYGNVAYNNDGACVTPYLAQDTNIYNNTCYKNTQESTPGTDVSEIWLHDNGTDRTQNINIKNNAVYAADGADDYGICVHANLTNNPGIVIDNNVWFKDSGDWYKWGASTGDTIAGWRTASSQGASDLNSDPNYKNAPSDLSLNFGSPAINSGDDLGAPYNDALNSLSIWPTNVLTGDQDDYDDWEMGAYYYYDYPIRGVKIN